MKQLFIKVYANQTIYIVPEMNKTFLPATLHKSGISGILNFKGLEPLN